MGAVVNDGDAQARVNSCWRLNHTTEKLPIEQADGPGDHLHRPGDLGSAVKGVGTAEPD
jgi:hypothetical protein